MGKRKEYTATVISSKMQKTIIAKVTNMSKHPKYGRILKTFNKFKVHDEKNEAHPGDLIRIEETRPMSKDKRWRLVEIIKKARSPHIEIKDDAAQVKKAPAEPVDKTAAEGDTK